MGLERPCYHVGPSSAGARHRHSDDREEFEGLAAMIPERRVEDVHRTVLAGFVISAGGLVGGDGDDGALIELPARRAVERGVTEAEDPAVGRHQPVALAVWGGGHADDRLVERMAPIEP